MRVGVIGLGDMGSGLAKNLISSGFETTGYDLLEHRMDDFKAMGGTAASDPREVGVASDALFVMVMNGDQAKSVLLGEDGAGEQMPSGSAILLTATIHAREAREIAAAMEGTGVHLIDSPVSGGRPGAHGGTLTMMASAPDDVLDTFAPVMQAVGKDIHRVGTEAGMGQTVKACLQSLIGSIFSATYEASVLAAKAGVSGEVLQTVFGTSAAGNRLTDGSLDAIMNRKFEDTGSGIGTMHKDLTIAMDLARDMGVPLFTASMAMQLFQAGITKFPEGDNQSVTKVIEDIVGVGLEP